MTRVSKLYSTSVIVLSLSSLIENLAYGLPLAYFPNYAISLGASVAYVGFFTAAFMLTTALLSERFGGLSDRIGRKRLIEIGLFADVILGILTGVIQSWIVLLLIRALNGIATAAVSSPAEASLVDQVPKHRRGEALGFYLTLGIAGWTLGPLFGGTVQHLAQNQLQMELETSYRIPFFVDSLLAAIAMALVAWKVTETRGSSKSSEVSEIVKDDVKLTGWKLLSVRILYFVELTNGFAVGFIAPLAVLFFDDLFNATTLQIGFILTASGSVGLLGNFFAGKLADRIGRKPVIAFGSSSSRLSTLVMPFVFDINSAAVLMVFRSMGHNVAMPASRALRADLVPAKIRGKLFGRLQAFFNLGMIIGPILGTWLYDLYRYEVFRVTWPADFNVRGLGLPFFISGILGLTALALLLIFVKEPPRQKDTQNRR